jgi:hypothetical protein
MTSARYRSAAAPLTRMMAADETQRADKTAVAAAIAKAAFDPSLALAEELQQQVQNFDGLCELARIH